MKRSTFKKRALASVLALTMAASVLPAAGFATGEDTVPSTGDTGDSSGLHLNKTAKLEDDGTYTINLEAYATGEVTVETSTMVKPTDIVLVLDQSGSMTDRDHYISGIPTGNYTRVNGDVTIQEVADGGYYYKVGDAYYRLRVDQEEQGTTTVWVDDNGNTYDQVSNTWTDRYGHTCTINGYYAVDTLEKYHRQSQVVRYRYVNDTDSTDASSWEWSADEARSAFTNKYEKNGYKVYFNNYGDSGDEYTAAVYMPVTQQTVTAYSYTFYYVDANGEQKTVGTQTGSETDTYNVTPLYTQQTTTGPRRDALKYAANTFIESIRANAVANQVDHRVAVVGFGSDSYNGSDRDYYYSNTELFVGGVQYNYAEHGQDSTYNRWGNLAANHYGEAFQSVNTDQGYRNLQASINALAGRGATYPQYGFDMASGVFNANGGPGVVQGRSRVVIFLTDGEPGDNGYDGTAANAAVSSASTVKNTYGATVYTVAVLSSNPSGNVDQFLKATSSNDSYTLATNAQELENFFETVDDKITSTTTTVDLTENAILKDVLGSDFTFPADYDVQQNVTVQKAKYEGDDRFGSPTDITNDTRVTYTEGTNTIDVSGFDYVATENLVTENGGENSTPTGYKLIVTIKGVLAKDSAAGKGEISTNSEASGIYDKNSTNGELTMIEPFDQPKVTIGSSIYVLDYAKEATLPVDTITRVNRLDSSDDQEFSKVEQNATSLSMTYGDAEATEGKLTYEPKTMDWKDYDTFYALGKDGSNVNQWSKISVMPANNVYYEDDFMVNTEGSGIVYTGDWRTVTDGTSNSGQNTETPNTEIHGGWKNNDLADDSKYSDGSAYATGNRMATATFTFTGTGVDVYGRTNNSTGIVVADLYTMKNGQEIFSKTLAVDTSSESGDYYQIPTLFFSGLEYGTYKVVLTVATEGSDNFTFYLDGVRVYNPIQGEDVDAAYGNEAGAMFQSVRDILLSESEIESNPNDLLNGAVFIDQLENGDKGTTDVVGTYKDYGPKNEVYLAPNQSIAFTLDGFEGGGSAYIGLKAPAGATAAKLTDDENTAPITVDHSTDLYYEITPNAEGLFVITNTGTNLLSITKLRTTGGVVVGETSLTSLMSYMSIMDTLPEVPYGEAPVEEVPGISQDEGSVDIVNPDQDQSQETPTQGNTFMDFLKDIFESLWGLF